LRAGFDAAGMRESEVEEAGVAEELGENAPRNRSNRGALAEQAGVKVKERGVLRKRAD